MPAAFLHPYAKPTRETFIRIDRGEGALVWDESGRELVDGMASLWYCAVGHGRIEIAEARARSDALAHHIVARVLLAQVIRRRI